MASAYGRCQHTETLQLIAELDGRARLHLAKSRDQIYTRAQRARFASGAAQLTAQANQLRAQAQRAHVVTLRDPCGTPHPAVYDHHAGTVKHYMPDEADAAQAHADRLNNGHSAPAHQYVPCAVHYHGHPANPLPQHP